MATATVTAFPASDNTPDTSLPMIVEQDDRHPYSYTEEHIKIVMDDFHIFEGEVNRKMKMYRKVLGDLSSDLYKDVYKRLVGGDTMSFCHEALFQGWHGPGYNACEQVKDGLDDMWSAFKRAQVYARAMQRPRQGGAS